MSSHRLERINTQIKREISEVIQQHLRDPRLTDFIGVTEVSTSPDLKHAKVYISSIGGVKESEQVLAALNSASGMVRSSLAKSMKMRFTPQLHFTWDTSIEHGDRILRLIDQVEEQDKK